MPRSPPRSADSRLPKKILLVEEIWDQVAASPETLPIPEWHRAELDRRLVADVADPGRPWSEIRDEPLCR